MLNGTLFFNNGDAKDFWPIKLISEFWPYFFFQKLQWPNCCNFKRDYLVTSSIIIVNWFFFFFLVIRKQWRMLTRGKRMVCVKLSWTLIWSFFIYIYIYLYKVHIDTNNRWRTIMLFTFSFFLYNFDVSSVVAPSQFGSGHLPGEQ